MYLITAATRFEMEPFLDNYSGEGVDTLVTGVGQVETAVRLTAFLSNYSSALEGVINIGVGGAYVSDSGEAKADLLDICLAKKEVFGDFGVCLEDRFEPITGEELEPPSTFTMDEDLLERAMEILEKENIFFRLGNFVTVNCTTGFLSRGKILEHQHQGLCENMEGASIARVCQEYGLPCLEMRCISNLVEDRDTSRWQLKQACKYSGEVAAKLIASLVFT